MRPPAPHGCGSCPPDGGSVACLAAGLGVVLFVGGVCPACLTAGLGLHENRLRSFAQLNRRYVLFTVLCAGRFVSALTYRLFFGIADLIQTYPFHTVPCRGEHCSPVLSRKRPCTPVYMTLSDLLFSVGFVLPLGILASLARLDPLSVLQRASSFYFTCGHFTLSFCGSGGAVSLGVPRPHIRRVATPSIPNSEFRIPN